ncbi:MAG: acyl-CoA thioesterase [Firmicutes bacterium]|nr:acyl-CoA thioesterase [Bacillota bacterium]
MNIVPYERKAHYYETDQMGVVHHSNYIRWFEEARVDFMDQLGLPFAKLEEEGIISPVVSISCSYKQSVKFDQRVLVSPYIKEYNGIKLIIEYKVAIKETGVICCTGESKHCFLVDGRPVSLKKASPRFDNLFNSLIKSEE